ncbi:MAG: hypothetical protein KDE53_12020, partial [Caldilineaceae bacterium]|nr:hypothetical protein [Caldilineaceae bacterium]
MSEQSVLKIPHGIALPGEDRLYVTGMDEALHCLQLHRGNLLARADLAAVPLTAQHDTVIAWHSIYNQSNTLQLIALQMQEGGIHLIWEQTLALPAWVVVTTEETDGFLVEATIQNGELLVTWEAHGRYRGGAPPPAQVEAAATQVARHVVHLDLQRGTVRSEQAVPLPARETATVPPVTSPQRVVPYRRDATWETQPWAVDASQAHLVTTADGTGIVLVHTERSGTAKAADTNGTKIVREITLTDDAAATATVTPDGRYLFVHTPTDADLPWRLFAAASGELLARFPFEEGTTEVAVVDQLILYLVVEEVGTAAQETLCCRALTTGERRW